MRALANSLPMNETLGGGEGVELRRRIFFVLIVLVVYRLGSFIPIPGINPVVMSTVEAAKGSGVLALLNAFTGGAMGRMSIFALNIIPYITASIIMQLMTVISKEFAELKKAGELGRKKIVQYTRYLTIFLALIQGYGIATGLEALNEQYLGLVAFPGLFSRLLTAFCIMGGTVLVMWFGEQISSRGIGNGSSIIIFTGIISGMPRALAALFELGKSGSYSTTMVLGILCLALVLIAAIVFIEKSQRRVLVQYPKRQVGREIMSGGSMHLPLKINTAGVIPPIFASALLSFPATIIGFQTIHNPDSVLGFVARHLVSGKPLYLALYVGLIVFFSFLYTTIIFNSKDTAENLKKNGGVVLGRRPGEHTAEYFDTILSRLTAVGALYLSIICVIPELLMSKIAIPFYLGGTSLLIVVNVVIDLFTQIQSYTYSNRYAKLLRHDKKKKRR